MTVYLANTLYDDDDETFYHQVGLPGDTTLGDDRVTGDPVGTVAVVVGDQAAIADLALADVDAAAGEATAAALDDTNTAINALEAKVNDILAKLRLAGVIAT